MPDLTFASASVDRNPTGAQATSETWLHGSVASRADAARERAQKFSADQASQRLSWKSQPVGGRAAAEATMSSPLSSISNQQSTAEQPLFESRRRGAGAASFVGAAGGAASVPYDVLPHRRAPDPSTNGAGTATAEKHQSDAMFFDGGRKGRRSLSGPRDGNDQVPVNSRQINGHHIYESHSVAQNPLW